MLILSGVRDLDVDDHPAGVRGGRVREEGEGAHRGRG
jgi:hypothetical protein